MRKRVVSHVSSLIREQPLNLPEEQPLNLNEVDLGAVQVIMGRKPTNGKPHRVLQKDGCWSPAHCSLGRMCLSGMCLTKFSLTQIPQLGIQCLLREATAYLSNSSPPEPPLPRSHTP